MTFEADHLTSASGSGVLCTCDLKEHCVRHMLHPERDTSALVGPCEGLVFLPDEPLPAFHRLLKRVLWEAFADLRID